MKKSPSQRLEAYTRLHPDEVLLVICEEEEILVYKGFSSSLVNPTANDPDIPILADNISILRIDRLKSPYSPQHPQYIEQGLTWQQIENLLTELDL
jgi:hypothetical protein